MKKTTTSSKPIERSQAEASERLDTVSVDAPSERFQDTQQRGDMAETTARPEASDFMKKKVKSHGAPLKQEVVAEALGVKGAGGNGVSGVASPSAFGLKVISFSGDTGTLLGNASGTPSMGKPYQGDSRIDKRLSDANKDINYNASEQVMVEYDNIPPLAASESTVGYNGNPKNVAARSQKKTGFTPAEILYDRSLDFIEKDGFVFSTGQVVKQDGINYGDYPTSTRNADDTADVAFTATRGNFSPRTLEVKVKKINGKPAITSFQVLEDDLSANSEADCVVNSAATNHLIDMNRAELTRQTIDADAGSPTSEHFNPLGRSVAQPTATVAWLQDLENVTGAEVFASYKFANKARAHFLSRTAKDGQALVSPAIDALYGHLTGALDSNSIVNALGDLGADSYFSTNGMRHGSAAILIPLFDSTGKYKTKGDLVNQPRGLKMHLQTADNNMDPFRVKKEFVAALNSIDAYSTIDHAYDPTAPVYIMDNVRLVHPYSWAAALKYHRDDNGKKIYDSTAFRYVYSAGSGLNSYIVTAGEPVLNGVSYFMDLHINEIYKALKGNDSDGEFTWTIPVVHSTTHFSLWDLLVCASTPYIIYERTNTMKDILDYEMFYKYPFTGNVRIAEANPLAGVNYGVMSPYSQMPVKEMQPSSSIRWKYPEMFAPVGDGYLAPYYFNERSFDFTDTTIGNSKLQDNHSGNFTTPVVRSGIKLSGLDDFFSMDVKDQLLITDRMVRIPGNADGAAFAGCIYKYSQDSDGIPVLDKSFTDSITAKDVYATPRLLGWYADAPAGVCCSYAYDARTGATIGDLPALDTITVSNMKPSFRAIQYKGVYGSTDVVVNRSLQVGSVNVNRAQSFVQQWAMYRAGFAYKSDFFDLVMSVNEAMKWVNYSAAGEQGNPKFISLTEKAQFSPFVYGPYTVSGAGADRSTTNTAYSIAVEDRPILFSPHLMLWTMLQKLCFVINPFENTNSGEPGCDPFGTAYLFGLAGFMAANYDEEVYNRANAYQNQGYGYTSDPMVSESPIFKDAYKYTQVG